MFSATLSHPSADVAVIELGGELDMSTSPALDKYVKTELRDPRCGQLILDTSRLSFCGVGGLSSLMRADELARENDTRLYLVPGEPLRRLLRLTGLQDRFRTCLDRPAALSAGSASAAAPQPALTLGSGSDAA